MKAKLHCFLVVLALLASLTQTVRAVGFTITPSAVTNTYNGTITLLVTGLNSGETVTIQKFLDLNTNGFVDASDYLVQQFQLTDGQAGMVIGGVTNNNVPGDTDSTAGQITAKINFQAGDFMQNLVGNYLYKLSRSTGPVATNLFTVTNTTYAQKITGSIVNSSTNVPNAVILLFPAPSGGNNGPGTPLAGAVANNSGNYAIQVPPGTYVPMAFRSNFVANLNTSPVLTLGSGVTTNVNLAVTTATASISGKVVDANNNNIGLPGVFEPASDSGLIAVAFTATNGSFTMRVTSGQWNIGSSGNGLIVLGYVGYQNGVTVNSGSSGNTGPYSKATALFYGSVMDNLGNPLPGVAIEAYDNSTFNQDGYSDANGNYVVGAVGGQGSGDPWKVNVDNSTSFPNYLFAQSQINQNGGTNISTGQAVQQNFTAILATNHITGHVKFNGTNVSGVQVYADATIGTNYFQAQMNTDTNGNYSLNVGAGDWTVNVYDCGCSDNDSLNNILAGANYQDPGNQNVNINGNNSTNNFIVQSCNSVQIISTSPLPVGEINVPYDQFLQASSCNGNFTWSTNSGILPPGLQLDSFGELFGTPGTNGTFSFSVHVTDGSGNSTNQSMSLTINSPIPVLAAPVLTSGGQLQLSLGGNAGNYYTIEFSTNLINWVPLLITNPPNAQPLYLDFPMTNKAGFFQAYESGIVVGQSDFSFGAVGVGTPILYANITNGIAVIPITRTNGLSTSTCVNYSTSGGTAIGGCDYTPVSGTLCFAAGVSSNSISIPVSLGCSATNQSATVNLLLSDTNGINVLNAILVIQRPKPVLAVYPTSLTLYVPDNCGQSITISNAGPQGSVLNYTLADSGALGGYLNFNGQGPVSPAIGSLQAGQSAQVTVTVLDQFATNWIGGTLTTAPSIYTPGAANYLKYPLSVTIISEQEAVQNNLLGTWSGTWSSPAVFYVSGGNVFVPASGTWTMNLQQIASIPDGVSSGTLTIQGASSIPTVSGLYPYTFTATYSVGIISNQYSFVFGENGQCTNSWSFECAPIANNDNGYVFSDNGGAVGENGNVIHIYMDDLYMDFYVDLYSGNFTPGIVSFGELDAYYFYEDLPEGSIGDYYEDDTMTGSHQGP